MDVGCLLYLSSVPVLTILNFRCLLLYINDLLIVCVHLSSLVLGNKIDVLLFLCQMMWLFLHYNVGHVLGTVYKPTDTCSLLTAKKLDVLSIQQLFTGSVLFSRSYVKTAMYYWFMFQVLNMSQQFVCMCQPRAFVGYIIGKP